MPNFVRAIDVSNHQPRDLSGLISQHQAKHVVVKLYLPEEIDEGVECARQQIASARAAGCTVSGYIWCYRSSDPRESVRNGIALARSAGLELPMLWLDCETYQDANEFDPGPDAAWLRAAIDECRRQGVRPGIYTGFWWVRDHFPGGEAAFAEFKDVPLWLADYDNVAELNFNRPFAGLTALHGKQYSADGIDLDVFLEECCSVASGAQPAVTHGGNSTSERFRVTDNNVRLRPAPGTSNNFLAEVARGTILEAVDDQVVEADGHRWRHVRAPSGTIGFMAAEFLAPAPDGPMPGQLTFNPDTPTEFQRQSWTCSIRSTMWMLKSIGINITPEEAQDGMSPRFVSPEVGLLNSSGIGIVEFLSEKYGLQAVNQDPVTFDEVAGWAGKPPVALGGRRWGTMDGQTIGHWVAVRGVNDAGELVLANPAQGPAFGNTTLNRDQFHAKGSMSAVRIIV